MAKSKTRFNKPRTWAPHAPRVMAEDVAGGWVRLHDYNELLRAYRGALCQLDRAAKRVATMMPNALAQASGAGELRKPQANVPLRLERWVRRLVDERTTMRTKTIQWMGRATLLACDGNCAKAWGFSSRPKQQMSDDHDDVSYLADAELGDAPLDPGTYEGGCAKPASPDGMNKWCARECERSDMAATSDKIVLPNYS